MFYRKRSEIFKQFKWKVTLDITRSNMRMMDEVRRHIEVNNINEIEYVFCDVNCQPTLHTADDRYIRFNSTEEARNEIEKVLYPRPAKGGTIPEDMAEVNNGRREENTSGDVPADADVLVGGDDIVGVVGSSDVADSEPGASVANGEEASAAVVGAAETGD